MMMDKNRKHHRDKAIPPEEMEDFVPPGSSSFSTEEGREAQGMREDLGGNPQENRAEPREDEPEQQKVQPEAGD